MKILIILMTTCLMQVSASTYAQRISLSEKNASLISIFQKINKQSGVSFLVSNELLAGSKTVNIKVKDEELDDVLETIFKGQPLSYELKDKVVIVTRKEPSFLDNIIARFQAIDIRGQVVDSLGDGVSGATVVLKGIKQVTQTGADGNFYLKNVAEDAVLVVSYLGYVTKEQAVVQGFNRIQLQLSTSKLDEVQIQAYGKTSRRLSTGNIVTIKADEIAKQPINNPLLALQGRVPNLVISPNSGLPGAGITLQLRGQNSLSAASLRSEPLIVIDGVPQQNNLNSGRAGGTFGLNSTTMSALGFLNPKDIEQIDVLADADATAIYGSRGANGVIMITTKRGKTGQNSIDMSITQGFSAVTKKLDLMNTGQYLEFRRDAYAQDGLIAPNLSTTDKNSSNFDLTLWDQIRYTDWQEEFLGNTAPSTDANLSISGGSNTLQYRIGGNFNNQKYVFPGDARFTTGAGNLSLSFNSPNQKFRSIVNGSYTYNSSFTPTNDFTILAVTLAPNAPAGYIHNKELNWEPNPNDPNNRASWQNPYAQLLSTATSSVNSFRASTDFSYIFSKVFTAKLTAGLSRFQNRTVSLVPIAGKDPSILSNTGSSSRSNLWANSLTVDPQVSYVENMLGGRFDVVIGGSYQRQSNLNENTTGLGYTSDALLGNIGLSSSISGWNSGSEYKYFGGFARINYNFDNKYVLNLSGRRDGSSRFGPGKQYGNFWSIGAAWIFTNEKLISSRLPWLSFGKLRGSYGSNGNDGIGDYQYIELYEGITKFQYQAVTGIKSRGAIDPNYHWEDVRKLEIGLELGFLKDRLLLSSAYWRTRAFDQLGTYPLPLTAGAAGNRITINQDANIQNMGWDLSLNSTNISTKNFSWASNASFGLQNNKLLSIPDINYNGYGLSRFAEVGKPFTNFAVVYEYRGINPANGLYQFSDNLRNISSDRENGYVDAKKIDTRPVTLGVSNSISLKGFNFSFFVELTRRLQKNPVLDFPFTSLNPGSFSADASLGVVFGNLPVDYLNNWKKPGDNSLLPKSSSYTIMDPFSALTAKVQSSDFNWVDASYARLRNVTLSYSMLPNITKRIGMQDVTFILSAQNVFTLTKFKGLDPEVSSQATLPLLRTVTIGIQVKL